MSTHPFQVGNQERVTRGKYSNQTAEVVKLCPKKIQLRIVSAGEHEGMTPHLLPDQLLLIANTRGVSGQFNASSTSRTSISSPRSLPSSQMSREVTPPTPAQSIFPQEMSEQPQPVDASSMSSPPILPTPAHVHSSRVTIPVPPPPAQSVAPPSVVSFRTAETSLQQENAWAAQGTYNPNPLQQLGLAIGNEVRVTDGKYKDQTAEVLKICPQKIKLRIVSAGEYEGVTTHLLPDRLLLISNTREVSGQSGTSRVSRPSIPQPTRAQSSRVSSPPAPAQPTAPVPVSIRGRATPQEQDNTREVSGQSGTSRVSRPSIPQPMRVQSSRASREVTPPQPTQPTAPAPVSIQARATPQDQDNPWAVQGAHDPDYHQELGLNIGLVVLEAPGHKSDRKRTMAYKIFGDRLLHYEIAMGCAESSVERFQDPHFPPKTYECKNGRRYELLCAQVKQSKQKGDIPLMKIWIQYVLVSGPGIPTVDIQQELEAVADFGIETPHKAAARIKLLNSPAVKSNRKDQDFFLINLDALDFEMIDDPTYYGYDKSMGCGYIPRSYIEKFLGNHAIGKRTSDIQVRVWCPALGVYKGMLTEKPGIHKIQITRSMRKLAPSRVSGSHVCHACLVIAGAGLHPTKTNVYVGNILSGGKEPPDSFIPKKLGFMLETLWKQCGVSQETIDDYVSASRQQKGVGLEHANVVGVPDPTDSIPAGFAFIPGFESVDVNHVLLNKYPSCGAQDAMLVPLVKSKPAAMSESDWSFLRGQHFGKIIFGNPADLNTPPIPAQLGVDMDGDLYFICWNKDVLAECQPNTRRSVSRGTDDDATPIPTTSHNPTWFDDARNLFFNLRTMVRFSLLIKALYKAWKKEHTDGNHQDIAKADAYGRAFKQSLDLEKQGKKVFLPRDLWDAVPLTLHGLLCDNENETLELVMTPSGVQPDEGSSNNNVVVASQSSLPSHVTPLQQTVEQPRARNNPPPQTVLLSSPMASSSSHAASTNDDTDTFRSLPVVSDYDGDSEVDDEDDDMMSFQTASSHDNESSLFRDTFHDVIVE